MQISKAQESLNAAELCYEHKLYDSTASRAYYAMFQAAVVALESAGVLPDAEMWSHKGLQSKFALELVHRRKTYPRELTAMLSDGLNIRNTADYSDGSVSERMAGKSLRWAHEFVGQVQKVSER
jgi:uncharacterized protein (UPF0332 family)